jgi:glycosyltransferase involved in cell wall biosynthesis
MSGVFESAALENNAQSFLLDNNILKNTSRQKSSNSRKIRILLDARKILDGGIGTYIQNLIRGLTLLEDIELSVLASNPSPVILQQFKEIQIISDNAKLYSVDELFFLPKRIDFTKFDVFHVPHFTLPFRVPIPTVVTIHDLIHVYHPERVYYPWVAAPWIRSTLKRAHRIISVSKSTYEDINNFVSGSQKVMQKVRVVPNAINPMLFTENLESKESSQFRSRNLGKYFFCMASNLKPHKGLIDLLHAFEILLIKIKEDGIASDIKLVLAGQGIEKLVNHDELLEKASQLRGVNILGQVNEEELKCLYQNALALVVPSTTEGFCLPVLEAQSLGTPVVCRPVPALKELVTINDILAA